MTDLWSALNRIIEDQNNVIGRLIEDQSKILMRVTEVERRNDNQVRHGKVTDVDTKKQRVRIEIGERDGKPVKSPWVPYAQIAGDYKSHRPPTKGQQMTLFAPNGEFRQAVILPFTWSDQNKSPSDKEDEHVTTYDDKYRLREKKDLREFTLDKTKQVFTKDKIVTSVNDGNTPKDGNGANADDPGGEQDQAVSQQQASDGSSISQEKEKIVSKVKNSAVVHDQQGFAFDGQDVIKLKAGARIEFEVAGSTITIEPEKVVIKSDKVVTDGMTLLGDPEAVDKVVLETGPATKVKGI